MLLSPLARLLQVDINTLLCFNETLTENEIGQVVNDIAEKIYNKDFQTGFEHAMNKIHEYPTCHKLILNLAMMLEGSLYMFAPQQVKEYEGRIIGLYELCMDSNDIEIKYQAMSMLISNFINKEEFDQAQELMNEIPNIEFDKQQQQGNLYIQSGKLEEASELFEHKLISATTEINTILLSMIEIAVKEKRYEDAEYYAHVVEQSTKCFDLWECNAYTTYFQLYSTMRDEQNCILTLKKLLPALKNKWDLSSSRLYKHIKTKEDKLSENEQFAESYMELIKNSIENELDFLKGNDEFRKLINS